MFADQAKINIRSGKGGDGCVSFRREKYVQNGGPDGGDGGNGGNVIFEVELGANTLNAYRYKRNYCAEDGEAGKKRNCRGKDGQDIILKVPPGTVIKEAESGKVMADMADDNAKVVLLTGGRGGSGNQHYATSSMQTPRYAKPGQDAIKIDVILELKVIADVGLVGFPNVGKSTLLSVVSNARPKIADYHFTTLSPNLGVVDIADNGFVIADIPGLIEGAALGAGLGHDFLRHIERTRMILHVVDAGSTEGRDPIDDIKKINAELSGYSEYLSKLPQVIAANKIDALEEKEVKKLVKKLEKEFAPTPAYPICAVTKEGVDELLYAVIRVLDSLPKEKVTFDADFDISTLRHESVEPADVYYDEKLDVYFIEGPMIEKMLGYTNLEAEKGFLFFQEFLKKNGIIKRLESLGINQGDTVRMYGFDFEYIP